MTTEMRRSLTQAVKKGNFSVLANLYDKDTTRTDPFSLAEFVPTLSRKTLPNLWALLNDKVKDIVATHNFSITEDYVATMTAFRTLSVTAAFVDAYLGDDKAPVPAALESCVIHLHDTLLALSGDDALPVQNLIVKALERYYYGKRPSRDSVVPQTISVLLIRALDPAGTASDVKRVYEMREGLQVLDFSDPHIISIKHLLLRAFVNPMFLRTNFGKKFLASLFTIDMQFIDDVHDAIKNQIPTGKKSLLEVYGDLYFKAWQTASGGFLMKIEHTCIQDIMNHAIHASQPAMAKALQRVLSVIHQQKHTRGVDAMLARLYEPILWRALKMANPAVRFHGAAAFIDAFPLQDPDHRVDEADALMQRQFDALRDLLRDPYENVRRVAVQGVCRILGLYWEMIPVDAIKMLVTVLTTEMVHDSSSPAVRAAVFEGFTFVLDNHMPHRALKEILPSLAPLINDKSERVRSAFLKLLLRLKNIRAIRFYDVVSIDALLTRLAVDSPAMQTLITQVLLSTYFPHNKGTHVQLTRAMTLLKRNPLAAFHFFKNLVDAGVTVGAVCKFICAIYKYIASDDVALNDANIKKSKKGTSTKGRSAISGGAAAVHDDDSDASDDDGEAEKENATSTLRGSELLRMKEALLDVMALLWSAVAADLRKYNYKPLRDYMYSQFDNDGISQLMDRFGDNRACKLAVMKLASFVPATHVPALSSTCLPALEREDITIAEYAPLLECICAWGQADDVLRLVTRWMEPNAPAAPSPMVKKAGAKRKRKQPKNVVAPITMRQRHLALEFLQYLLANEDTRVAVLASDMIDNVNETMSRYLHTVESRLDVSSDVSEAREQVSDDFFVSVLSVYAKLLIHTAAADGAEEKDFQRPADVLAWAELVLLPALESHCASGVSSSPVKSRQRIAPGQKGMSAGNSSSRPLVYRLMENVFMLAAEFVATGIGGATMCASVLELTDHVSRMQVTPFLTACLVPICKVVYQLCDSNFVATDSVMDILGALMDKVPGQMLASAVRPLVIELLPRFAAKGRVQTLITGLLHPTLHSILVPTSRRFKKRSNISLDDLPPVASLLGGVVTKSPDAANILAELVRAELQSNPEDMVKLFKCMQLVLALQESDTAFPSSFYTMLEGVHDELEHANESDYGQDTVLTPSVLEPVVKAVVTRKSTVAV